MTYFSFQRTDVIGRLSRNVNRLFVPRVFTNYGKPSFYYRGTVLWDNLRSGMGKTGKGAGAGVGVGNQWVKPGDGNCEIT